jgi:hypothetical protein
MNNKTLLQMEEAKRMPQLWKPLIFERKIWPLHPKPYIIELVP